MLLTNGSIIGMTMVEWDTTYYCVKQTIVNIYIFLSLEYFHISQKTVLTIHKLFINNVYHHVK